VEAIVEGTGVIEPLKDRIVGRIAAEELVNKETGEVIVPLNGEITEALADEVVKHYETVKIRSVLTCRSPYGVCRKCYGRDLGTGNQVQVGEAVGIIAAQSIGEPGTQLTMRTFHTGGVAGDDITQGLPRVEELFEARKPKRKLSLPKTKVQFALYLMKVRKVRTLSLSLVKMVLNLITSFLTVPALSLKTVTWYPWALV